jgi:hypothetical protein
MGLRGLLLSGWASMPGALKQACRLGAVALLAVGFLPSRAAAQNTCPGSISANTTLTPNSPGSLIKPASGQTTPCITVTTDGVTVNLNGDIIDLTSLGDNAVAIDTGTTSNTTIAGNGGIIDTEYSSGTATSAIKSSGGTNLTISGVTVNNEVNGNPCNESYLDTNWGTGISLTGVTGATITGITVSCYQVGISVQDSAIASHGGGSISGNSLYWNIYDQASGQNNSAGIVLSNSSGWTVSNNTIEYNGSADANGSCVPGSTTTLSCAFGLQVINGSYNNSISNNGNVSDNYGGGIYTGPATSKNTIAGNTALSNGSAVTPLSDAFDLYDAAPAHSNHWHHNSCAKVGGSVPSNAC